MATKKQIFDSIIKELDELIPPLEEKHQKVYRARLDSIDFDDENYLCSVQDSLKNQILIVNKLKNIVIKNFK